MSGKPVMLKLIPEKDSIKSRSGGLQLPSSDFVPNFAVPRNVASEGFLANLKSFFTPEAKATAETKESQLLPKDFEASFFENLKEWFRPGPKLAGGTASSLRGAASPGIKMVSQTLYGSLFQNIRDIFLSPKMPPLEISSKPVDVPEIWSKQKAFSPSKAVSLFLHVALTAFLLVLSVRHVATHEPAKPVTFVTLAPRPAPPPPPAAAPAAHRAPVKPRKSFFVEQKLIAPVSIPKHVDTNPASDDSPASELNSGMAGGDPAGVLGGKLGGVPGGISDGSPGVPAPPAVSRAPSAPMRIGGNIKRPREIYAPQPEYPALAQKAKTEGAVVLDAVIDEHGNIVNLRPLKGNVLLIDSALKAVSQWKYEPTYLNGIPVSIEMEVRVEFILTGH